MNTVLYFRILQCRPHLSGANPPPNNLHLRAMSDCSDDEAPEEVTLGAGRDAVAATRAMERKGRRYAEAAAKRRRVDEAATKAAAKTAAMTAAKRMVVGDNEDDEDDEVEVLDENVVAAVAARPARRDAAAVAANAVESSTAKAGRKAAKLAARRAARRAAREAEEGYVGGGVWEKDGYEVVVADHINDRRGAGSDAGAAFLAGRMSAIPRSASMLMDPKTGGALTPGTSRAMHRRKQKRK